MSRLGALLRAGVAKFGGSKTSFKTRGRLFRKAAHWVDRLGSAGPEERASLLNWVCHSPEHLKAFFFLLETDPALRRLALGRIPQAAKEAEWDGKSSATKWDLKNHPLVVTTGAVIVAVGLAWRVFLEFEVKPRDQQIERLQAEIASVRKLVAPSADNTEASEPRGRIQRQRPDQQRSLPPVNEGEVGRGLHR
jgi:ferric-dicitrate binding protein FerR (iron transport regulator)